MFQVLTLLQTSNRAYWAVVCSYWMRFGLKSLRSGIILREELSGGKLLNLLHWHKLFGPTALCQFFTIILVCFERSFACHFNSPSYFNTKLSVLSLLHCYEEANTNWKTIFLIVILQPNGGKIQFANFMLPTPHPMYSSITLSPVHLVFSFLCSLFPSLPHTCFSCPSAPPHLVPTITY